MITAITYRWTDDLDKKAGLAFFSYGFFSLSQVFMNYAVEPVLNAASNIVPSLTDSSNTATDVAVLATCTALSIGLAKIFSDRSYWGNKFLRSLENAANLGDTTNSYFLAEKNKYVDIYEPRDKSIKTEIKSRWTDKVSRYSGAGTVFAGFFGLSQLFMNHVIEPILDYGVSNLALSAKDPFDAIAYIATPVTCGAFSIWLAKRFSDKSYWGNIIIRAMKDQNKDESYLFVLSEPNPYSPK